MRYLFIIISLLGYFSLQAQQVPAEAQSKPILIKNVTAHLGNGTKIDNATIGFDNGKITFIGTNPSIDVSNYTVIDGTGKHVYPGFIALDTQIGLKEIDAVRATRDNAEVGYFNPSVRSLIAYSTDSKVTPTIRSNGVMLAQITPQGGRMPGQSSVVKLDGWNWEDAQYRADDGQHLNWPYSFRQTGWWAAPGPVVKNKKYDKQVQELKTFLLEAKAYNSSTTHRVTNLKFEAMRGVFADTKNFYVHVNSAKSIMEAVLLCEELGIKPIIVGGADAWKVTDFLKEHKTPVIITRVQGLPERDDDDIDQIYKIPAMLSKAGVDFAFSMSGAWEQRNLVFQAGQAVSYGLPYEKAIEGLTLGAAKILGIDKTTGSLEQGKDATLIIVQGDALDMRTCVVEKAFIQGAEIDLDNKQKALSRKFTKKLGIDVKYD